MRIQTMFKDDIERKINGVVKVDQDESGVLVQELDEYVMTGELKKQLISFFEHYGGAFRESTTDIGVWVSGFFGSGKSHFLKMLSCLLENREVGGVRTVERFREKLADDPAAFRLIETATGGRTDTILFNIDVEGPVNKDKTAVLRVFAKMFYTYLGFYGEDLKVAKLEQFIERQGKTEAFRRAFEEKSGASWLSSRDACAFFQDDIVSTLQEVLGMSRQAATNWFNGGETVEISIARLASEIKEYVDRQPPGFRLLFMADEVGQYVGGDTDLLMNLQSLVEKLGSECRGKVWVVCAGQEAIDEIVGARESELSRIQARFKIRLSLSSASVDEVIQKRILSKTGQAAELLERVYARGDYVLRNLFSFTGAAPDIKGYSGAGEFVRAFPFVPYQFTLLQKVFAQIRRHGDSGQHLPGGERSMLSGFQEAARKIKDRDEYALVPFYLFYDTVHSSLDGSIRRVIERCERAAAGGGLEARDVDLLKLLYLVRYVDDVKANLDNLAILMADDIRLDKIATRERVRGSLDRLLSQNTIGRSGDTYIFLTDEEHSIQREIHNTPVDAADVVGRLSQLLFTGLYPARKFRAGKYVFSLDRMVDGQPAGPPGGDLSLRVITAAADPAEKQELRLLTESAGKALVVLAGNGCYESLERAMKIRKYVKQRDMAQLPQSARDIVRAQQDQAGRYELSAAEELKKAVEGARFYVDGERLQLRGGDAKSKLDRALEYLASHVYSGLGLITRLIENEAEIGAILRADGSALPNMEPNRQAADRVEKYLELRQDRRPPATVADLQEHFQRKPYGWREIDIAAVTALLIRERKVTVQYGGAAVRPEDPRLPELLRKKSEFGRTVISRRRAADPQKLRRVRDFIRDYYDEMDVPESEEALTAHMTEKLSAERRHYEELLARYQRQKYPDRDKLEQGLALLRDVLSRPGDDTTLIDRVLQREDALRDMHEGLQPVEDFFRNQAALFDAALALEAELRADREYLDARPEARQAMDQLRLITMLPETGTFDYRRIPELNGLTARIRAAHDGLLEEKRSELAEIVARCAAAVHRAAGEDLRVRDLADAADRYFSRKKEQIASVKLLALLDGLVPPLWRYRDEMAERIETLRRPTEGWKELRSVCRQSLFPAGILTSEEEIDAYADEVRSKLKQLLKDCGGIRLN